MGVVAGAVSAAVAGALGIAATDALAVGIGGMVAGSMFGAAGSAVMGGDPLQGALFGGVSGGAMGALGAAGGAASGAGGAVELGNTGFQVMDAVQPLNMGGTSALSDIGSGLSATGADALGAGTTWGNMTAGFDPLQAAASSSSFLDAAGAGSGMAPISSSLGSNNPLLSLGSSSVGADLPGMGMSGSGSGAASGGGFGAPNSVADATGYPNAMGLDSSANGSYGATPPSAPTSSIPTTMTNQGAQFAGQATGAPMNIQPQSFFDKLGSKISNMSMDQAGKILQTVGGLGMMSGGGSNGQTSTAQPIPQNQTFGSPLQTYSYKPQAVQPTGAQLYASATGQAAAPNFYDPASLQFKTTGNSTTIDPVTGKPKAQTAQKRGGKAGKGPKVVARIPAGTLPGGQDDTVPILAAPDEHVIPADVVAHLGDGSSQAGHAKLQTLAANVRQQKTGKKNFPPKAKPKAASYMGSAAA